MLPVYTRLLGRVDQKASGEVRLYLVPVGEAVIVRDLTVVNLDAAQQQFSLFVVTGAFRYNLWTKALAPSSSEHLDLRQRLLEGDELKIGGNGLNWDASVTGYVFSL